MAVGWFLDEKKNEMNTRTLPTPRNKKMSMMAATPRAGPAPCRVAVPSIGRSSLLPRPGNRVAVCPPPAAAAPVPKPARAVRTHAAPTQSPPSTPSALPAVPVDLAVEDAWKPGDPPTPLMQVGGGGRRRSRRQEGVAGSFCCPY